MQASEGKQEFISRQLNERIESYVSKPLHGYYIRNCGDTIDKKMSFYWLVKGDLSLESEGFILAAQEQSELCVIYMTQKLRQCVGYVQNILRLLNIWFVAALIWPVFSTSIDMMK